MVSLDGPRDFRRPPSTLDRPFVDAGGAALVPEFVNSPPRAEDPVLDELLETDQQEAWGLGGTPVIQAEVEISLL